MHKRDLSYKSVPVSRVSSSSRLNLLGNTPHHSIPNTPGYVSSSLNPIRNLPVNSGNYKSKITTHDELEQFEKLPIVNVVGEFEQPLAELSSQVSTFREEGMVENVQNMIRLNDDMKSKITGLEEHKELGKKINKLHKSSSSLDAQMKRMLKELISYRNDLKALPRRPANNRVAANNVEVTEVLKYAMKLAKFTKAPATVANAQFQIHPNNYVWPAEDALRRGMLAASSLQEDEIVKQELGEDAVKEKETEDTKETKEVEPEVEAPGAPGASVASIRRDSFGDYSSKTEEKKKEEPEGLDLDLFDPDDEFSD